MLDILLLYINMLEQSFFYPINYIVTILSDMISETIFGNIYGGGGGGGGGGGNIVQAYKIKRKLKICWVTMYFFQKKNLPQLIPLLDPK